MVAQKYPWYIMIFRRSATRRTGNIEVRTQDYQITIYNDMNKSSLVEWVHGKLGGTKVQAEEIVEGLIEAIITTLKKGEEVSIAGLGIFSVKQRAARMARNPKTGEQVKVAATTVPKFRAAKALKDAVK